jgi:hypothetical protein
VSTETATKISLVLDDSARFFFFFFSNVKPFPAAPHSTLKVGIYREFIVISLVAHIHCFNGQVDGIPGRVFFALAAVGAENDIFIGSMRLIPAKRAYRATAAITTRLARLTRIFGTMHTRRPFGRFLLTTYVATSILRLRQGRKDRRHVHCLFFFEEFFVD